MMNDDLNLKMSFGSDSEQPDVLQILEEEIAIEVRGMNFCLVDYSVLPPYCPNTIKKSK